MFSVSCSIIMTLSILEFWSNLHKLQKFGNCSVTVVTSAAACVCVCVCVCVRDRVHEQVRDRIIHILVSSWALLAVKCNRTEVK